MTSTDICAWLSDNLPTLFVCSPAPVGGVRVRTPFMYPDGDIVDIFVLERSGSYVVTDYGDGLGWLRTQSVRGRLSAKQRSLVDDVCMTLGVELNHGQLILRCEQPVDIGEAVHRLGQAVVRVSDLWFTMRSRAMETTADAVDEWLREKQIDFEREVKQLGRSGQSWTIDYRTRTDERTALVFLLSTGSRGVARRIIEHVLAGCVDLSHLKASQPHFAFVSLFDDTEDVWRAEDFGLVEDYSEIALWSRRDEFERILTTP